MSVLVRDGQRPTESVVERVVERLVRRGLGSAHRLHLHRAWRRFARAAADPRAAQLAHLRVLLRRNAATAFGREHRFGDVDGLDEYRRHVPVRGYRELSPWIERVARGESGVLTDERVRMMEVTGGSSAAGKWIPYTSGMLREVAAGTEPWLYDVHRAYPALFSARSYWSISPAARGVRKTPGGLPIGFDDDAEYFGPIQRRVIASMMAVPGSVARLADLEEWRHVTCRHLLAADDLGLISVWSPTFLTLLMEHVAAHLRELLARLSPRRAADIERALDRCGRLHGEALWPRLALVSCWGDGPSAAFLRPLRRWFPRTPFQPKGLLATEGLVSFPLTGHQGAVLSAAGHFLELLDVAAPDAPPKLLDELVPGSEYSPILTTAGGLYRYHLKDVVTCVGHIPGSRMPLVRFERKLDCVTDLTGEKIDAGEAAVAIDQAARAAGASFRFALLSPEAGPPARYRLYLETDADDDAIGRAAGAVEAHLQGGHHYRYCRELGQLSSLAHARVRDGWSTWQAALVAHGQRAGDIKPTFLDVHGLAALAFANQRASTTPGGPT